LREFKARVSFLLKSKNFLLKRAGRKILLFFLILCFEKVFSAGSLPAFPERSCAFIRKFSRRVRTGSGSDRIFGIDKPVAAGSDYIYFRIRCALSRINLKAGAAARRSRMKAAAENLA
jgi:hypothetical protein